MANIITLASGAIASGSSTFDIFGLKGRSPNPTVYVPGPTGPPGFPNVVYASYNFGGSNSLTYLPGYNDFRNLTHYWVQDTPGPDRTFVLGGNWNIGGEFTMYAPPTPVYFTSPSSSPGTFPYGTWGGAYGTIVISSSPP